jgi:hypothetical protein
MEAFMSIVVRYSPTSLTTEKYDESVQRLEAEGLWPADGCDSHVCFGSEGNLKVSEIWDSREQLEAFAERMMHVLAEVGVDPGGNPEILEVHHLFKRS